MPTPNVPLRAAVLCRYPLELSGWTRRDITYLYFLADDIDMATSTDGTNIITGCQTIELLAVA